jgi:ribosome-associated translation inhibitor RaiA
MTLPLQITFRHFKPSAAVAARIRAEVLKLNRYYDRITSCRVTVESPHRHHKSGSAYRIAINLGLPREEIVIQHAPRLCKGPSQATGQKWAKHLEASAVYKNIYVSIRDAFKAARRRLEDHARKLRGDVKLHDRLTPTRAEKLDGEPVFKFE